MLRILRLGFLALLWGNEDFKVILKRVKKFLEGNLQKSKTIRSTNIPKTRLNTKIFTTKKLKF